MRLRTLLCALLAISLHAPSVLAQNIEFTKENVNGKADWEKAVREIKKGDKFYNKGGFALRFALPFYYEAYKVNPNSASLNYKVAKSLLVSQDSYQALPFARKALELNSSVAKDAPLVLAQSQHMAGEFEDAIAGYSAAKSLGLSQTEYPLAWLDKCIEECRNGIALKSQTQFDLKNLGPKVNTEYSEYVPLVKADGDFIIFTGRKPEPKAEKSKLPYTRFDYDVFEDIYKVKKESDTSFSAPAKIGLPMDIKHKHDACISLSPDGKKIYLYTDLVHGEIREAEINDGSWGIPAEVKGIDSKYYETHISVSADNQTAYVVSNRKGGLGGRDIWKFTRINDKEWGNAENLGDKINTIYDEDGVFIHPDGKTLYFSSKGHSSMGGYDVFMSKYENNTWSAPVNLGPPVNTPGDDIFFVLTGNGEEGYISSAREGGFGGQDIYRAAPKKTPEVNLTIYKGSVVDGNTGQPIAASVVIVDNTSGKEIFNNRNDVQEGFLVSLPSGSNYGISVNAEGYIFHSENIDLRNKKGYNEETAVIRLYKIESGNKFVLNNVFFDFDKADLKSESIAELNRAIEVFKKYPDLKFQVEGHTDSYGAEAYNVRLSQMRAEAVKQYLIRNGIAAVRITKVTGFGESNPVQTNETPEGRAKNRRVEFKLENSPQ